MSVKYGTVLLQTPELLKTKPRKLNVNYHSQVDDYKRRLKYCSVDGKFSKSTACALCDTEPATRVYV